MARGQRRLKKNRQIVHKASRLTFDLPAVLPAGHSGRSLAFNALALTAAIVSVLTPAHAVTMGEIAVESAVGQPLSARVPVTLQPGESMGTNCVSVPTAGRAELSQLPNPLVTAPEVATAGIYDLRLTTTQALYEPMYELQLQVRCPGTALVVRQYVLMLDLPGASRAEAAATPAAPEVTTAPTSLAAPAAATSNAPAPPAAGSRPARVRVRAAAGASIENGTRYRVQAGDALSTIAARISDRAGRSIWATADQIFAANPEAFINGNPDLIKLGSEIVIPGSMAAPAVAPTPAADATLPSPPAAAEAPAAVPGESAPPAGAVTAPPTPALLQPPVSDALNDVSTETEVAASDRPGVFKDEQAVSAEAGPDLEAVEPPVAARDTAAAQQRSAPTWLAMLVGLLIGATASVLLLRDRLLATVRGLVPAHKATITPLATTAAGTAAPRQPITKPVAAREPSMMVVEERRQDDADDTAKITERTSQNPVIADAVTDPGNPALDSDLSRLFGESSIGDLAGNAEALPSMADLDLDLSAATPDGPVDAEIGWLGDDTGMTTTQGIARVTPPEGDTVEHADLQTMAHRAPSSKEINQTLADALNLLESDYELELTASQVLDQKKIQEMLAKDSKDAKETPDDGAEDTLVRTGTDQFPRR